MHTQAFALVNDLELVLPRYQAAREEFRRVDKALSVPIRRAGTRRLLERQKEQALGEVVVRVNEVLEVIQRHKEAL